MGKKTQVPGKNVSNLMNITIQKEEEEEYNKCFDQCFDNELLDLSKKRQHEVSLE